MEKIKFPERLMINAVLLPMDLLEGNEGQIPDVPTNPRFIRPEKYEALKKSLTDSPEMLGFREIVAYPFNGKYVVIDGNMRTRALREIGYSEVPVKVLPVDTSAEKLREYVHKDNYEYGENDQKILHEDWAEFEDEFDSWGMDDIFMEEDMPDEEVEEDVKNETPPMPLEGSFDEDGVERRCEKGDLWILGDHKLLCGDSTNPDDFRKIMGDERAQMCFTSPPYNAGSINQKDNPRTHAKYGMYDDNKSSSEYLDFLSGNIDCLLPYCDEIFYNIGLVSGNKKEIFILINKYLDYFKDIIYWEKSNCAPVIQEGVVNNLVEFILCFGHNGTRKFAHPQFSQGSYYNVIKGNSASDNEYSKIHKATFPVYLPFEAIKSFTDEGAIVIDCFGGTGTTMMACEQLGRKARLIELDPHYCDVILERWEKATGKKAERVETD